jgi:hypothetical protein
MRAALCLTAWPCYQRPACCDDDKGLSIIVLMQSVAAACLCRYPHCLAMLDLLQSEHFRQAIASPMVTVSVAGAALSTCLALVLLMSCCMPSTHQLLW